MTSSLLLWTSLSMTVLQWPCCGNRHREHLLFLVCSYREGSCPFLGRLSSCFSIIVPGARSAWAVSGDATGASSSTSAPIKQPVRKEPLSTMKGCVSYLILVLCDITASVSCRESDLFSGKIAAVSHVKQGSELLEQSLPLERHKVPRPWCYKALLGFWGISTRWSRSPFSWGYAACVFKTRDKKEQAGREAASGEVEQMPSLWLPQVALEFYGGWRQADLPLSRGKCSHLLLDLLHCEHSPVPSQDKVTWDAALIEIQVVKQPLVDTAMGSNVECFSA